MLIKATRSRLSLLCCVSPLGKIKDALMQGQWGLGPDSVGYLGEKKAEAKSARRPSPSHWEPAFTSCPHACERSRFLSNKLQCIISPCSHICFCLLVCWLRPKTSSSRGVCTQDGTQDQHGTIPFKRGTHSNKFRKPRRLSGKESICWCRGPRFSPWVRKSPWRKKWQSTPVLLPRKCHRQRSLVGYSPWGCKESDKIEWLSTCVCLCMCMCVCG